MASDEKEVVICLTQPPIGTLYPVEGLRMAVALAGDMEPITVVIQDGVYAFLKTTDMSMYEKHYSFIKEVDLDVLVDKQDLEARGLTEADLIDGVEVKDHQEILEILTKVSTVIPF